MLYSTTANISNVMSSINKIKRIGPRTEPCWDSALDSNPTRITACFQLLLLLLLLYETSDGEAASRTGGCIDVAASFAGISLRGCRSVLWCWVNGLGIKKTLFPLNMGDSTYSHVVVWHMYDDEPCWQLLTSTLTNTEQVADYAQATNCYIFVNFVFEKNERNCKIYAHKLMER